MKNDYSRIAMRLPHPADRIIYEEGTYIHILSQSLQFGSLLLEEMEDGSVIIWNDELNDISYHDLFMIFLQELCVPIYVVYVDNKEEYEAIINLCGEKIDFSRINNTDIYESTYGCYKIVPFQ